MKLSKSLDEPLPEKSFREVRELVQHEHAEMKRQQSELLHYSWRRWQCFEAAYAMTFGKEGPNAARQLATILLVPTYSEDKHLGAVWPRKEEFVTFASFHVEAGSALAVITAFNGNVHSANVIARTQMRMGPEIGDLTASHVSQLWQATRAQVRKDLFVDKWPEPAIVRDRRILQLRLLRELRAAESEPQIGGGESQVSYWDKRLLLAMYELKAFNNHYLASPKIFEQAEHPTSNKRAFNKLTKNGLVLTAENKKGRSLTQKGLRLAKLFSKEENLATNAHRTVGDLLTY